VSGLHLHEQKCIATASVGWEVRDLMWSAAAGWVARAIT